MNCYKFVFSEAICILGHRFKRRYLSSKILFNDKRYYTNWTAVIKQTHQAESAYKRYYVSKTVLQWDMYIHYKWYVSNSQETYIN